MTTFAKELTNQYHGKPVHVMGGNPGTYTAFAMAALSTEWQTPAQVAEKSGKPVERIKTALNNMASKGHILRSNMMFKVKS